jgi:aryl-alcohol dehydrogenase-like predicted oxidoreductase
MRQRRSGDSDLVCSALGFGTWEMSTTQYGAIDVGEASQAANSAIDRGITLFDSFLPDNMRPAAMASPNMQT